jgi:aryl-alcohol dehydrogenase-like predicted oxidoreductase
MEYRQLGSSDLRVSEISLGSWLTYGVGVERDQAESCVRRAFEVGVNFIDTANAYGRGAAESFLGEVLTGVDRASYVLATKVFFPMSRNDRGLSAAQIRKQCDASLQRLRTDHVDLYQCHRYDTSTPLEETMEALTEVVRQGKARYVGFSEWSPAQIRAAIDLAGPATEATSLARPATEATGTARRHDLVPFISSQPQYSMLWRRPEQAVIPLCAANGIGQIVWSPLGQGVLTGKYRPGSAPPPESRAASESMGQMMGNLRDDKVLVAVDGLRPLASQAGLSMAQLALAWVLREANVASAIIGATRPEQVDDNAAASGVTLDADLLAAVDDVLAPVL